MGTLAMRPTTIFLDRDGVINRKRPEGDYVKRWEEFEFLPGVLEAIPKLNEVARRVIVVTNQRGVARGRMTEEALQEIHRKMLEAITAAGGRIDAVYHCPHEEGTCECRKPRIGLFLQAKRDFPDIDFREAVVVGDSPTDLEAAQRLGCGGVLVVERKDGHSIIPKSAPRPFRISAATASLTDFSRLLQHGCITAPSPQTF